MVYGDSVNVHDFLAGGELPAADENSVHKEIVNRIVEPYMWHTAIISATEWENFFHLRLASDAQPQIRTLALTMKEAMNSSQPELLSAGQWHLPLVSDEEKGHYPYSQLLALSAGRCARVSYLTHDKRRDVSQDMKLAQRLLESGHMSPFEHQAQPKMSHTLGNFTQWRQFRHDAEELQGQGKSLL